MTRTKAANRHRQHAHCVKVVTQPTSTIDDQLGTTTPEAEISPCLELVFRSRPIFYLIGVCDRIARRKIRPKQALSQKRFLMRRPHLMSSLQSAQGVVSTADTARLYTSLENTCYYLNRTSSRPTPWQCAQSPSRVPNPVVVRVKTVSCIIL